MTYSTNMGPGQSVPGFGPVARQRVARGCGLGGMITCLLALAIPLFWIGIPSWQVRATGVSTVGTATLVSSCGTSTDGDGNPTVETYQVSIQFTDQQGRTHQVESHWACNNFYSDGQQVSLWYLPGDPSRFLTDGEAIVLYITSLFWVVITFVVLLNFFILLVARLGRKATIYNR